MTFLKKLRDPGLAHSVLVDLRREVVPDRVYHLMEFCGGHTHAISRLGLKDVLPANIRLIHGPGCPVCVLPIGRIDMAIGLVENLPVILCSYGDCLRVPATNGRSLLSVRAGSACSGAEVRMVYSALDALTFARENPDRQVVFFAIGFETTTPPTAVAALQAKAEGLGNFSIISNHVLTPPAIRSILESAGENGARIDGIIGPAHVSTIIGTEPYAFIARAYRRSVVIAGFEPMDILNALLTLVRRINAFSPDVTNEYTRAVSTTGNIKAQNLMAEVFETRSCFEWRGLGTLPNSALRLTAAFADLDAERRFDLSYVPVPDNPACRCGEVLQGLAEPTDCPLFGKTCSPSTPVGACMVSHEGACAAAYSYDRMRTPEHR